MKSDRIKNWPKVVRIGSTRYVEFRIDLTLHDADAGTCLAVMDTNKYKITDTPTSDHAYPVSTGNLDFAGCGCACSPSYKSRQ